MCLFQMTFAQPLYRSHFCTVLSNCRIKLKGRCGLLKVEFGSDQSIPTWMTTHRRTREKTFFICDLCSHKQFRYLQKLSNASLVGKIILGWDVLIRILEPNYSLVLDLLFKNSNNGLSLHGLAHVCVFLYHIFITYRE